MAETVSEGIINCFVVTTSQDANVQLTRIHEDLFARKHEHLFPPSVLLLSMTLTLALAKPQVIRWRRVYGVDKPSQQRPSRGPPKWDIQS